MKQEATYQKLRGGYYTPMPIASFLAQWAITTAKTRVLEPGCGDGNFLEAAARVLLDLKVPKKSIPHLLLGIELDKEEGRKALNRLRLLKFPVSSEQVQIGDFFANCRDLLMERKTFDAVIGNPPFIRYQNFPEDQRRIAFDIMESAGLHPNRLTNAWVPYLVGASLLTGNHGRLGMVIPSELMQVNYAAELRQFLIDHYSQITLLTFRQLLFGEALQEVVLFLGEKNGTERKGIRTLELGNSDDLASFEHTDLRGPELKPLDHSTEKWTLYFLTSEEISLLRRLKRDSRLTRLGDVAEVDVGIVTGLNDFFILNRDDVKRHSLDDHTLPMVTRSAHLPGILFSEDIWKANAENSYPAFLLDAPDAPFEDLPASVRDYISTGESQGFNKGYKCRIRNRWYIVPSYWVPQAFLLRQVHNYPKVILNRTQAACTDTIHRMRFKKGAGHKAVTTAFLNSLTFAYAEVMGRSYGGGVLELEPREAENLPIPLQGAGDLDMKRLNRILLEGNIESVLDITDSVLLRTGLGLSQKEILMLRGIWHKLRNRRHGRRHLDET